MGKHIRNGFGGRLHRELGERSKLSHPITIGVPKQTMVRVSIPGGIPTPVKNMSSSVGSLIPNIWKVIKAMFQTTNQL